MSIFTKMDFVTRTCLDCDTLETPAAFSMAKNIGPKGSGGCEFIVRLCAAHAKARKNAGWKYLQMDKVNRGAV